MSYACFYSIQYEEQVYDAVMSWVLVDSENRFDSNNNNNDYNIKVITT
jgi:hypothetical protein